MYYVVLEIGRIEVGGAGGPISSDLDVLDSQQADAIPQAECQQSESFQQ
jgi:hypothetical protein